MTTFQIELQATNDAADMKKYCEAENCPFVLVPGDTWDASQFEAIGIPAADVPRLWPVYREAFRKAVRDLGGEASN